VLYGDQLDDVFSKCQDYQGSVAIILETNWFKG